MADALCGPSNALQSFQKHTSVDRTLQQDRLVGRHSPSQGFRSSSAHPGALDAEFEAFQAGQAVPLPQQSQGFHNHLPPPQFAQPQVQFAQPQSPYAPDWASDFQRLNLASTHTPPAVQQHRAPASNASPASWHQDFMMQQANPVQAPILQQQRNGFTGMGYGMNSGFAQPNYQHGMGGVAQGKQRVEEQVPHFDEAAFEQAFAQAQEDMIDEAAIASTQSLHDQNTLGEEAEEPALQRLREQRPGVYAALKIRSAIDTGKTDDTQKYFDLMDNLEKNSTLIQDAPEGRWIADTLRTIASQGQSQESTMRAESLVRAVNERLMSTYPLHSSPVPMGSEELWRELEAAGYTRGPVAEQITQQPEKLEQKPQDMPQPPHDNDEIAETAGQLLERVADNTSSKFQNSQFLQLMRRLRDREVRVEGDKMVEVSETSASSIPSSHPTLSPHSASATAISTAVPSSSTSIPPIDPNILNYAATDFAIPVSSPMDDNFEPA